MTTHLFTATTDNNFAVWRSSNDKHFVIDQQYFRCKDEQMHATIRKNEFEK
jgi:hypothetical protein